MPVIGNGSIVPRETNGGMPVNLQDQTSKMLDLRFIRAKGNQTTIKVATTPDSLTIDINDTTGFTDGNRVGIFCPATGEFYFGNQIGAPSGDTITLDTPLDYAYDVGCTVINATYAMNLDGSGTRKIFQIGPVGIAAGIEVDVTKIVGVVTDNLAMDDSKFGGLAALAKGCVLRKNNGRFVNYGNFKKNGDFSLYSGRPNEYTDKGGGGAYSMQFEINFSGQGNHGVAIRLEPQDILELIVQDDLTDLISFEAMAQGHLVTN